MFGTIFANGCKWKMWGADNHRVLVVTKRTIWSNPAQTKRKRVCRMVPTILTSYSRIFCIFLWVAINVCVYTYILIHIYISYICRRARKANPRNTASMSLSLLGEAVCHLILSFGWKCHQRKSSFHISFPVQLPIRVVVSNVYIYIYPVAMQSTTYCQHWQGPPCTWKQFH